MGVAPAAAPVARPTPAEVERVFRRILRGPRFAVPARLLAGDPDLVRGLGLDEDDAGEAAVLLLERFRIDAKGFAAETGLDRPPSLSALSRLVAAHAPGGPPPARLLSLSRLVSRSGRTLTGIDRVELAYAEGLLADPVPLWGLVRTALGFVLLDREGVAAVARAARTGAWGRADLLSRLSWRLAPERRPGQSLARAHAVARARHGRLDALLGRLPWGTASLLVGHSDLSDETLATLQGLGPVAVLLHDTIPLDLPALQRPGTPEAFARRLAAVARHASLVVAPSEVAAADVRRHLAALPLGEAPDPLPVHAVPLGVPVPVPDPGLLPPGLPPPGPYVVALGTIEPRKDHAFLLDLWETWEGAPPLLILGSRGWGPPEVFARLDRGVRGVTEVAGLPDGAVAALLRGAAALLQPSRAEGFGLPAVEAAALGTPVVCGDGAIVRETLGDRAIACPPGDRYHWRAAIEALLREPPPRVPLAPPSWADHLKAVLSRVS